MENPRVARHLDQRHPEILAEFQKLVESRTLTGGVQPRAATEWTRRVLMMRGGLAAPNLNAYAERFVQTLRTECLGHFQVSRGAAPPTPRCRVRHPLLRGTTTPSPGQRPFYPPPRSHRSCRFR